LVKAFCSTLKYFGASPTFLVYLGQIYCWLTSVLEKKMQTTCIQLFTSVDKRSGLHSSPPWSSPWSWGRTLIASMLTADGQTWSNSRKNWNPC
jgi:hypothetical protein